MDVFDRDLEGIFEHRARDFSPQLRELLRELWLEGVRHGRDLERLDQPGLERRLAELARERPAAPEFSNITVTSSARTRELRPEELTLEMITRAAAELERELGVRQLEFPTFGFGRWLEEVADADPSPWRPSSDIRSSLENVQQLSRRELFGSWEDE